MFQSLQCLPRTHCAFITIKQNPCFEVIRCMLNKFEERLLVNVGVSLDLFYR